MRIERATPRVIRRFLLTETSGARYAPTCCDLDVRIVSLTCVLVWIGVWIVLWVQGMDPAVYFDSHLAKYKLHSLTEAENLCTLLSERLH